MKNSSALLRAALFCVALVSSTQGANSFEGRVQMTTTEARTNTPLSMQYSIKGDKMRFDLPGEGAFGVIVDFVKNESLMLIDRGGQKSFMRMALADSEPSSAKAKAAPSARPVATGRTETIAGHRAAEYKVAHADGTTSEIWLTSELGRFAFPSMSSPFARGRGSDPTPAWVNFTREKGEFPLRAITRDAAGAERSRFEVTKVEKTSLPDSLFSTAGYTEFQMPNMSGFPAGMNPFNR